MSRTRYLCVAVLYLLSSVVLCPTASALTLDDLSRAAVAINCRREGQRGSYFGTGVLIHPDGYVLTSTTVVPPGAVDISCHFRDALNREADLVAAREDLELAVVKVKPGDLAKDARAVALRRSDSLRIGETAFSYGDALVTFVRSGRFTISLGMVSGLYETTRNVPPQPVYVGPVIETTATMAAGMDGGPLFDSSGQVIGLLSLNVSESRWLGTAVPVDAFLDALQAVLAEDLGVEADAQPDIPLAVVDARGPSLFPVRDRTNAEFARAAARITPSVVGLEVDRAKDRPRSGRPRGRPRKEYSGILKRPDTPATGWLISSQGHILTSWFNVWGEVNAVRVLFADGHALEGEILGHDEYRDLAVVKVDPAKLPDGVGLKPLELTQHGLAVGDPVGVVGRSLGGGHTLTCGIVSATGRLDGVAAQIDAPVNFGSAGGALLDLQGRCVGLVSHVRTHSLWSQNSGVGLAIEADDILAVLGKLKNGETLTKPKRGYIGIRMSPGDLETRGVVVEDVQPDTPAEEAGLKARDVIVAIDDKRIEDPLHLAQVVGGKDPGTKVTATVRRGKKELTIEMTLDEHPYR